MVKYIINTIKTFFTSITKKELIFYILLFLSVFLYSYILSIREWYTIKEQILQTTKLAFIANFFIIFFCYKVNKKLFATVYSLLAIMATLYTPYALMYGYEINIALVNLLASNPNEGLEFISNIPIKYILLGFGELILAFIVIRISYNIKTFTNRLLQISLFTIALFLTAQGMIVGYFTKWANPMTYSKASFFHFAGSYIDVKNAMSLYKNVAKESSWSIEEVNPKYKNYIIIVGESVSADYMHLYGYPADNTPFLDTITAKINNKYYSAAPYTMSSLERFWVYRENIKDENSIIRYQDNMISLANKAGFETYWISNQGSLAGSESFTPSMANISKYHKFMDDKGLDLQTTIKDSEMLPFFTDYFSKRDTSKVNLFVLHTMGSHTTFDGRIEKGSKDFDIYNENVSQYSTTIWQADKYISEIYKIVSDLTDDYSIIYFSDHGLSPTPENDLKHGDKSTSYHIPFVEISSDTKERKTSDSPKTALKFLNGFANWTGIKVKELDYNYKFFSDIDDEIYVQSFTAFKPIDKIEKAEVLGK